MKKYKNLSGKSGVAYYEIGDDFIRIYFQDGSWYLYTYKSAGSHAIENLKRLAIAGKGLGGEVAKKDHPNYESKVLVKKK